MHLRIWMKLVLISWNLNNIEFSEDNQHYIKYEKEMILCKTNQEKCVFDVVVFVNRNIENLKNS